MQPFAQEVVGSYGLEARTRVACPHVVSPWHRWETNHQSSQKCWRSLGSSCELSVGLEGGDLEEHMVGGPGSRAPGLTGHRLDLTPDVVASLGGHTPHAPPSPRTAGAAPAAPSRPVLTAIYCSVSLMSSSTRLRGVAF